MLSSNTYLISNAVQMICLCARTHTQECARPLRPRRLTPLLGRRKKKNNPAHVHTDEQFSSRYAPDTAVVRPALRVSLHHPLSVRRSLGEQPLAGKRLAGYAERAQLVQVSVTQDVLLLLQALTAQLHHLRGETPPPLKCFSRRFLFLSTKDF